MFGQRNVTPTIKPALFVKVFIFSLGVLLMGCAKELPEKATDAIENQVFDKSLFDSSMTVETIGTKEKGQSGKFAVKASDNVSGFFALNEKRLYPVKIIKGPKKLKRLFKDVELEASGVGERIQIEFKLTNEYIVAYKKIKGDESTHLMELRAGDRVPVFQYQIDSYGIIEKEENDLGEKTHRLAFRQRDKESSSHLKFSPTTENRQYAGLRSEDFDVRKAVLNKAEIDGKTMNIGTLKNWLPGHKAIESASSSKKDSEKFLRGDLVRLKIHHDQIYLQKPVEKSELSEVELAFLKQEDPRIQPCPEKLKKTLALKECVVRPLYRIDIKPIKLKSKTDQNESIASSEQVTEIHPKKAKLVRINLEKEVFESRLKLEDDLSLTDENLLSKENIELEGEYLYVPMTQGTPRSVRAADPFYQGQEKIVKLKWQKDGLEVLEIESNERFRDNDLNNMPVFKIPGKHIEFRCQQNENDECVGGIEENRDMTWKKKNFFLPEFKDLDVLETNRLDLMTLNSPCLSKTNTRLVDYEVKRGVINVQLEKTYETANNFGQCLWQHYAEDPQGLSGFSDATFKTRFYYSLVKLDTLKSNDYRARVYPVKEHSRFG